MRIFLTGGSGLLGSHFAELAGAKGASVVSLVRPASNTAYLESLGVALSTGNLVDVTFMVVYALVSAVFGLGFVLAPGQVFPMYGVEPDAALRLTAQLFGAALISLAILTWLARNTSVSKAQNAILPALLVGEIMGFVLALIGQLNGVLNAVGWLVVVVYLLLALGLAYFQFARPAG